MTFVLGKSGSEKSTLLNILGGLDKYDSGDMIIYGKSSSTFTNADLDCYRNTYVGFVFQEFNLLEDYNVYENIILSLQLQEKDISEKELDELLEKLELNNYKLRKVNELSGGQKQRVAIARALIKNPSIILADEPTGNLDSTTGTQVMELLKNISEDKLVIIVTHDEEYANKYGDRIIEIKDGKIIKDTKEEKSENKDNNYQIIKSHLPFKDSFKLGIGSLKYKKVKLICTIILMIITLGFLSCVETLSSHNFSSSHAKYLVQKGEKYIEVENKENVKIKYGEETLLKELDENDVININKKLNNANYKVYEYHDIEDGYFDYNGYSLEGMLHIKENNQTNSLSTSELVKLVVTDDVKATLGVDIIGKIPSESNEIAISNYVANLIVSNGIEIVEKDFKTEFEDKSYYFPKTIEEIINSNYTYYLGLDKVKIVGIINYDLSDLNESYRNNVLSKVVVGEKFIAERKDKVSKSIKNNIGVRIKIDETTDENGYSFGLDILTKEVEYYDGTSWKKTSSLKDDEIILSLNTLTYNDSSFYENLTNYTNKHWEDYDAAKKRFSENYIKQRNIVGQNVTVLLEYEDAILLKEFTNLKVIGVTINDENTLSVNNLNPYRQKMVSLTSLLYPMSDQKSIKKTTKLFPYEGSYAIKSTYSSRLYEKHITLKTLSKFAFYVGLFFLAFTVFLIANFMFTSISYRKKEIGTLRALGSRELDVMKIFVWEAIVLSIISGIIASILLVIVSNIANSFFISNLHLLTTPFIVGIRQFIVIFVLVFMLTIISNIIPLHRISRMKPIDAILKK